MNILTPSSLVVAIFSGALIFRILVKNHKNKLYLIFSLFCLVLFVCHASLFINSLIMNPFWKRLYIASTISIGPLSLYFYYNLLKNDFPQTQRVFPILYIFSIFLVSAFFVPADKLFLFQYLGLAYLMICLWYCTSMIYQAFLGSEDVYEKKRLKYLLIGIIAVMITLALDTLARLKLPIPTLGNLVLTFYLYFLYQITTKQKIFDSEEFISQIVFFASIALMLTIIYALLVSWAEGPALFFLSSFVASLLIILLFEPIKTTISRLTTKFFYYKNNLEKAVAEEIKQLTGVTELKELTRSLINFLTNNFKTTQATIYLLDSEGSKFILEAAQDEKNIQVNEILANCPIFHYSLTNKLLFVSYSTISRDLEEATTHNAKETLESIKTTLQSLKATVCLPFYGENKILGFLAFQNERVSTPYLFQDIKALFPLAKQINLILKNLEIYEKLREREKLAILGETAAGLAHEIRNPLGAIKGAAEYLEEISLPDEKSREFLTVIQEEVNRLNQVVSQFLTYAKPFKKNLSLTNLNQIIENTLKLMANDIHPKIKIIFSPHEEIPESKMDSEQIRQVFINLIQNSLDAMPEGGKIEIKLKTDQKKFVISFSDNGRGLTEEQKEKIFLPFYTTKPGGTGLGMTICQKIIKDHGGNIRVYGEPNKGTEFIMTLPIYT